MNDLISRSALLEELSKGTIITDDLYGMGIMAGNDHAMKKIKAAPAVDAAVLPCKVGDTVYRKLVFSCQKETVIVIGFDDEGIFIGTTCGTYRKQHFNKTVFFTREEAEAAFKRRADYAD